MMLAFIIGTFFGMIIGMVLNHAIEEAERKRNEVKKLREIIDGFFGDDKQWN